jgi:hypothetical protein
MQDKPGSPRSPGKLAETPKSPRRRRTAKMGRVDYATMHALADLNYAINRGVPAATQMHCLSSLLITRLHCLREEHQNLVLLGLNFNRCKQQIRGGVLYAVCGAQRSTMGAGGRRAMGQLQMAPMHQHQAKALAVRRLLVRATQQAHT